jgi:dihydroorotase
VKSTLIKNGLVYAIEARQFQPKDLLIEDKRISAIESQITAEADVTIDASNLHIAPGFIDLHCHIFNHPLFKSGRLPADRIGVNQGVACLLDTGSAGPTTIDAFKEFVIDTQSTATYALCNIGSPGQPGIAGGHSAKPELVSLSGTVKAIERNPDWILGVKVLASSSHTGLMGLEAVKIGRKAAEIAGTPLMVHIGNAPPVVDDVLDLLRPGDIVTHAYHGKTGGVLGYNDMVIPQFRAAVERGVIVDIAHGRSSFSYETCEKALAQGMPIHTISSDLHGGNINRYVVSLARTMSKFRTLGLSLEDVIEAVTVNPAKAVGLDKKSFGQLNVGQPANLTVFAETDRAVEMEDAEGEIRISKNWIEPRMVFINGACFDTTEVL